MNQEEINVKVGLDGSPLTAGLRRVKTELQSFKSESGEMFEHASNKGREFHKLLHSIGEFSPTLASALKLAFSPVGGAIALATAALTFFNQKMEESHERAKKLFEYNLKPLVNVEEGAVERANRKGEQEAREHIAELHKPKGEGATTEGKTRDQMKAELAELPGKIAQAKAAQKEAEDTYNKIKYSSHGKSVITQRNAESLKPEIEPLKKKIEEYKYRQSGESNELMVDLFDKKISEAEEKLRSFEASVSQGKNLLESDTEAQKQSQKVLDERKEALDKLTESQKKLTDAVHKDEEAEAKRYFQEHLKWKRKADAAESANLRIKKSEQELADFQDQLAGRTRLTPGELSKYNTPYGRIQREIDQRGQLAKDFRARGRDDLAAEQNKLIYGEDVPDQEEVGVALMNRDKPGSRPGTRRIPAHHVPGLLDKLPSDLTTAGQEREKMKAQVEMLVQSLVLMGKGIPVNVEETGD